MACAEVPSPAADAAAQAGGAPAPLVSVEVVYSPGPGLVDPVRLQLPQGATATDALRASGLLQRHGLQPGMLEQGLVGIWCKLRDPATPLRDGDRVEIYRPLQVDPKEARRQRYARHRARYGKR